MDFASGLYKTHPKVDVAVIEVEVDAASSRAPSASIRSSSRKSESANKRAPRGIDLEQMHRRPADRAAVGLRPHGSWSAAVARWNAGRLVCIPDRGSALPASGNSGGTAGELAPHPTRGHLPSVHDVLSAGVDQERGVEQATRGRPARAAPRYHRGRSGRVPWCGISPKPAPTQANSTESRRCWICIRGAHTDTRHRMVHRVQLTLSIECLRRLSAVSLRTQWLTTPFRSTWSGLGPHDHACATGGQRGGAERRRCPV